MKKLLLFVGTAFYLAWTVSAAAVEVVLSLHYEYDVSMTKSCFGVLITLNIIIVIWFFFDMYFGKKLR